MKNIFYFIFLGIIFSCTNENNINTTNESINLMDSIQKINDSILAENQNLKLSVFETKKDLDKLNQVLHNKPNKSEATEEDMNKSEKNYSRKEVEEIVNQIRALYSKIEYCREYSVTHYVNPSNESVRAIGNLQIKIETDQDHNFIRLYNETGPERFNSEFLYLPSECPNIDFESKYFGNHIDRQLLFYYKKILDHPTLSSGAEIRGYYYNNKLIKAVFTGFHKDDYGYANGTYYQPFDFNLDVDFIEKEYKRVNF